LTPIGERGVSLSGGQKQRIAIARALINDPKILIFDEATSALDIESEYLIRQNIEQIASGRTLIMVAHRLSTVENCDKIFFMEEGKVLEEGTHGELMKKQGSYYHLYCQQAL
jgi:ATP-binding cassette, subfamily B, bacterial HlyB/CyaB